MATIFLTGGTGFIGKRLLPELAKENMVFLLVRKQSLAKAEKIISKQKIKNIKIIVGDLEQKKLGLSEKDLEFIVENIDDVYHLAASYDSSLPREKIFRINLEGTKEIVRLFEKSPRLKAFIHVSTAYIAGVREGIILEDELIKPKSFHNYYEEAKFKSEVFLRVIKLPVTVIRPSLVVGSSQSGEFDKETKSGFYQLIRTIDKGFLFFYPGKGNGFISAVPVNWLAAMIFKIGQNQKSVGKTFHLVDSKPMIAREFIDNICGILGRRKPFFEIPTSFFNIFPGVRVKNQISMLNQKQIFETTNTMKLFGEKNSAPTLISYLPTLINYYRKHLK